MILSSKNPKTRKAKIYSQNGLLIANAFKFNTRTKEVSMYILGKTKNGNTRVVTAPVKTGKVFPRTVVTTTVKIPGAYAILNGKLIK